MGDAEQVDARMAAIEDRFSETFSSEDSEAVRASVEATLSLSRSLRSAELDESDEPSLYPSSE